MRRRLHSPPAIAAGLIGVLGIGAMAVREARLAHEARDAAIHACFNARTGWCGTMTREERDARNAGCAAEVDAAEASLTSVAQVIPLAWREALHESPRRSWSVYDERFGPPGPW